LTIETRLVLQGFDPLRFDYEDADDPGRLARAQDIAAELGVDISALIAEADVEPDPEAEPGPMPRPPVRSAATTSDAAVPGLAPGRGDAPSAGGQSLAGDTGGGIPDPEIEDDHPLHQFADLVDEALANLPAKPAAGQRTGTPFAVLLKASLLMALYSVRNDRALCDHIRHNNLYRWFLGLRGGEGRYEANDFGVDREDVIDSDAGRKVLKTVVQRAGRLGLFRSDRLEVNGPLLKSWIS